MLVIERSDLIDDDVLVPKSGIGRQADIMFGNELAIQNFLFLRCYSLYDFRVRPIEDHSVIFTSPASLVVQTMTGVPRIEGLQLSVPRRITELPGQQHPDLQTDENMRQRQSHNVPYEVGEELCSGSSSSEFAYIVAVQAVT